MRPKKKKSKYVRYFAVASLKGELLYSCRTRRQGILIVDELTAGMPNERCPAQVVEVTKPLPDDVGERYLSDKPYMMHEFIG
jgi:hypothetical protein